MDSGRSRVFFALWPDAVARQALQARARQMQAVLGGRASHPDTLHLTLVFVGGVDDERLPDLAAAASRVETPAFELSFDRPDCWRHNHVAHMGPSAPPPALFGLVEQLETNLRRVDLPFDARPYRPHVTLVRKADCSRVLTWETLADSVPAEKENPATEPIFWPVRDFVLVRSSLRPEGARYEQMGRWPLL